MHGPTPFRAAPSPDDCRVRRLSAYTDLLALHRLNPDRYPFLLESVARGTPRARVDILFAFPEETLDSGRGKGTGRGNGGFLRGFDEWLCRAGSPTSVREEASLLPPFRGGWFLYLGYELAGEVEPKLLLPEARVRLPTAFATRVPAAVVRDHETRSLLLVAEGGREDLIRRMSADLERASPTAGDGFDRRAGCLASSVGEEDPDRYLGGVRRVLDYIRAGDVYQVNLSREWEATLKRGVDHADLYERLRMSNPGPFAGLCTRGDLAIVCSSPERLVEVRGRRIHTRPIAGTRPRGASRGADRALACELIAHPKERAEHLMLVDLERNDLGRVSVPGSVGVDEYMAVESYAHVHHIVSNVTAQLRDGVTPGEILAAVFPGGTITGCPKVRCMEIIAELEGTGRGPYTGSFGYVNRDGSMDLNILIRTMVRDGDQLRFRAGAGIVADSLPEGELAETRAKAQGLLLALGIEE